MGLQYPGEFIPDKLEQSLAPGQATDREHDRAGSQPVALAEGTGIGCPAISIG
ncbi:hypothetical protein D3C72_2326520 [compost metagenome]